MKWNNEDIEHVKRLMSEGYTRKDVAKDASRNVTLIVYESLHLEFGFGKKRIKRFVDRYNEIVECYDKGLIEFEDLEKEYKELLPKDYEPGIWIWKEKT